MDLYRIDLKRMNALQHHLQNTAIIALRMINHPQLNQSPQILSLILRNSSGFVAEQRCAQYENRNE
jgi:hypothetical protein